MASMELARQLVVVMHRICNRPGRRADRDRASHEKKGLMHHNPQTNAHSQQQGDPGWVPSLPQLCLLFS